MDNEKLDALLGWCFDTAQLRAETYAAALRAGVDVIDVIEFFNPTTFMEALAGHELKVGYGDFAGDTKGEFLLWAKDAICAEPETEPAQIPTQPPEFKLPYGWIELRGLDGNPFYLKSSEIVAVAPFLEADVVVGTWVKIPGKPVHSLCRETPGEVMEKITKSYPSISERFGGCV